MIILNCVISSCTHALFIKDSKPSRYGIQTKWFFFNNNIIVVIDYLNKSLMWFNFKKRDALV